MYSLRINKLIEQNKINKIGVTKSKLERSFKSLGLRNQPSCLFCSPVLGHLYQSSHAPYPPGRPLKMRWREFMTFLLSAMVAWLSSELTFLLQNSNAQ